MILSTRLFKVIGSCLFNAQIRTSLVHQNSILSFALFKTQLRMAVIRSINICDFKIEQKTKVVQDPRFFLRFFSPAHFDHQKPRYASHVPGDPVTRCQSKLEISKQSRKKAKVVLNIRFFLDFFPQLISTTGS